MGRLLQGILSGLVHTGSLRLRTARDRIVTVGDGTGEPIAVRFTSVLGQLGVILDPELRLGEAYMNGVLLFEQGSIADLLKLVMSQPGANQIAPNRLLWLLRYAARGLQQFNGRTRSRTNVAHHYDLDGRLYSRFLDADCQYSCGYFAEPDHSLEDAQLAKKRHLAAKLLLRPGSRVLDIGSGWGGLAMYLAELCGARVLGVTLSAEQLASSRHRVAEKGLSGAVEFRLEDYRDITSKFDRIVSVGMFEHVGRGFYPAFFRKCFELLEDDGVMLLHSIGRSEGPGITNPFIAKYIFPGGYIPALSEVLSVVERTGLLVADIEVLRLHYAETLQHWRDRFQAHRQEIERLYDARFCRMWEFYLAASEMAFRHQNLMVMQLQLTKSQNVVPITRDYVGVEEARLRARESNRRPKLRIAGE